MRSRPGTSNRRFRFNVQMHPMGIKILKNSKHQAHGSVPPFVIPAAVNGIKPLGRDFNPSFFAGRQIDMGAHIKGQVQGCRLQIRQGQIKGGYIQGAAKINATGHTDMYLFFFKYGCKIHMSDLILYKNFKLLKCLPT